MALLTRFEIKGDLLVLGVGIPPVSLVGNVCDDLPHITRGVRTILVFKHFLLAALLSRMPHVHVSIRFIIQIFVFIDVGWIAHLLASNYLNTQRTNPDFFIF